MLEVGEQQGSEEEEGVLALGWLQVQFVCVSSDTTAASFCTSASGCCVLPCFPETPVILRAIEMKLTFY